MTEKEELNLILWDHPELLTPALILLEFLSNAYATLAGGDQKAR